MTVYYANKSRFRRITSTSVASLIAGVTTIALVIDSQASRLPPKSLETAMRILFVQLVFTVVFFGLGILLSTIARRRSLFFAHTSGLDAKESLFQFFCSSAQRQISTSFSSSPSPSLPQNNTTTKDKKGDCEEGSSSRTSPNHHRRPTTDVIVVDSRSSLSSPRLLASNSSTMAPRHNLKFVKKDEKKRDKKTRRENTVDDDGRIIHSDGRICCPVPMMECTRRHCPLPTDPKTGVKFCCTNANCKVTKHLVHRECFESLEQGLLTMLSNQGSARRWTDQQRRDNLWSKKGLTLVQRQLRCCCDKGQAVPDKQYLTGEVDESSKPSSDMRRDKKKRKQHDLPVLNFKPGGSVVDSRKFHELDTHYLSIHSPPPSESGDLPPEDPPLTPESKTPMAKTRTPPMSSASVVARPKPSTLPTTPLQALNSIKVPLPPASRAKNRRLTSRAVPRALSVSPSATKEAVPHQEVKRQMSPSLFSARSAVSPSFKQVPQSDATSTGKPLGPPITPEDAADKWQKFRAKENEAWQKYQTKRSGAKSTTSKSRSLAPCVVRSSPAFGVTTARNSRRNEPVAVTSTPTVLCPAAKVEDFEDTSSPTTENDHLTTESVVSDETHLSREWCSASGGSQTQTPDDVMSTATFHASSQPDDDSGIHSTASSPNQLGYVHDVCSSYEYDSFNFCRIYEQEPEQDRPTTTTTAAEVQQQSSTPSSLFDDDFLGILLPHDMPDLPKPSEKSDNNNGRSSPTMGPTMYRLFSGPNLGLGERILEMAEARRAQKNAIASARNVQRGWSSIVNATGGGGGTVTQSHTIVHSDFGGGQLGPGLAQHHHHHHQMAMHMPSPHAMTAWPSLRSQPPPPSGPTSSGGAGSAASTPYMPIPSGMHAVFRSLPFAPHSTRVGFN